jgi:hypothetical protein
MLRPLPNLTDASAMEKLGRLSALRSARLDAFHGLRDCVTRLQSASEVDDLAIIADARKCLDRLEEVSRLEGV